VLTKYFQFSSSFRLRVLYLPVPLKLGKAIWLQLDNSICHFWWKHLKAYEWEKDCLFHKHFWVI
jgi:hypothetical protein